MGSNASSDIILTTTGMDGAATAALLLKVHPDARIAITSSASLARTLADLATRGPHVVHIAGVGITDNARAVISALAALRETGAKIDWYCGRKYLDEFREALAAYCSPILEPCASNAGCVAQSLGLEGVKEARKLLVLAEEFVTRKEPSEQNRWWHDFIESAAGQFFRYGDEDALPQAIRKLAGFEQLTDGDRSQVEIWRTSPNRLMPLGNSLAMKALRKRIQRFAPIDEAVLILGPSGAGKELVARSLHDASPRAERPFVPVNCAILSTSADLALDRLFGHEKGAFTGAKEARAGAFEAAHGGTLFLDEAGDLPLAAQTQLLRVLEERRIMPVGTMETREVDVRILAATNRDLPAMIATGAFRLDLYHRLNVLTIRVPPLHERTEDMKSIARNVLRGLKEKGFSLALSSRDWETMLAYPWPGNVRQFVNVLKRAAYLGTSVSAALEEELGPQNRSASAHLLPGTLLPQDLESVTTMDDVQRRYILHVLDLAGGQISAAAKALGIGQNTVRRWVQR